MRRMAEAEIEARRVVCSHAKADTAHAGFLSHKGENVVQVGSEDAERACNNGESKHTQ